MNIAVFYKHIMEALWAVGGIGASADLNMEDFGSHWASSCPMVCPSGGPSCNSAADSAHGRSVAARAVGVRGARRASKPVFPGGPLEAELCRNCCSKRSVR